jgi:hypothetical protein
MTTLESAVVRLLNKDQYFDSNEVKNTIILHHTAGSHRADWVVDGWNSNPDTIGTAFIIGGLDTQGTDKDKMDGVLYRCMPETAWAWSLGLKWVERKRIERANIGIELTSYGPLTQNKEGKFITYVNREVNPSQVVTLTKPWRGFIHWHKYSNKQLDTTHKLILELSKKYNIKVSKQWSLDSFSLSKEASSLLPGLYTHSQYRADKFDLSPQPELIAMLNSL